MKPLRFPAKPQSLPEMVAIIGARATANGLPQALCTRLALACEEITLNIAQHAYGAEKEGWLTLKIEERPKGLALHFTDRGRPFEKNSASKPPQAGIELRDVGGMGLHLIRTLVGQLSYRREENINHWTLLVGQDIVLPAQALLEVPA